MINITTMKATKDEILKAEWMKIIKSHAISGQSIREWFEENNISRTKFYYWQRVIRQDTLIKAGTLAITGQPAKTNIGKALKYALNHRGKLETYLEDGNCVISNNIIAENSIRPFTVGRRNWTFCGSPKGANTSACVYSLVETAKANGLNPYKYLEFLLSRLPGSNIKTNSKFLELTMPWDELIQKTCKSE